MQDVKNLNPAFPDSVVDQVLPTREATDVAPMLWHEAASPGLSGQQIEGIKELADCSQSDRNAGIRRDVLQDGVDIFIRAPADAIREH
jgi:hypothetical protein